MVGLIGASCSLFTTRAPEDRGSETAVPPRESGYDRARELFADGQYAEVLRILKTVESESSMSLPPEYFLLKGKVAAAQGYNDRARYYLRNLSGHPSVSTSVAEGLVLLADLCDQDRLAGSAFSYYLEAVNRFTPVMSSGEAARLHLRLATIALYERGEHRLAGNFLLSVAPELLNSQDTQDYLRIRKRLSWQILSADMLGVHDGNISALEIDGDDLWIGTWNGGVIRYSLASEELAVFRRGEISLDANTVRCIKNFAGRVWVGSYRGLYSYSLATSAWVEDSLFGGTDPIRVEVLEDVWGTLYAGTLGRGLWRLEDGRWRQIPGLADTYVNALCLFGRELAVGTMKRGLLLYDPETGSIRSFDTIHPGLEARNITMVLSDSSCSLWVGTYGQGLYHWQFDKNQLLHYSRRKGDIPDDWVLAGAQGQSGSYFGTFGGGVIHFTSAYNRPRIIGLHEGLPSLDISVVCSSPPFLYFGTLGSGVVIHYVHPEH